MGIWRIALAALCALVISVSAAFAFDEAVLGQSDRALQELHRRLAPLARKTPPLDVAGVDTKDAHWVRPTLVGEVTFSEETPDGRLRHPVWKGLRPDKSVDDLIGG